MHTPRFRELKFQRLLQKSNHILLQARQIERAERQREELKKDPKIAFTISWCICTIYSLLSTNKKEGQMELETRGPGQVPRRSSLTHKLGKGPTLPKFFRHLSWFPEPGNDHMGPGTYYVSR